MLFETQLGMRVQVAADVGELIRPATDVLDRIGGRHDGRPRMMPNRPRSVNDTPTRDAKRASMLHPALFIVFHSAARWHATVIAPIAVGNGVSTAQRSIARGSDGV